MHAYKNSTSMFKMLIRQKSDQIRQKSDQIRQKNDQIRQKNDQIRQKMIRFAKKVIRFAKNINMGLCIGSFQRKSRPRSSNWNRPETSSPSPKCKRALSSTLYIPK
jgi:hypothetical protein